MAKYFMKPVLLLLLTLLLKNPLSNPPTVLVTFSPLSKAAYLAAQKACVLTKPKITFPLKKVRGRFVIPTAKGTRVFQDKGVGTDNDGQEHFDYLGYLTDFKYHLVKISYYETTEYLLINKAGSQISLSGEPVFAPDMRQIAAICPGIEYSGGQPNIVELLKLQNGTLHRVWSLEPKTWEPYRICWASDAVLLLSRTMWTGNHPGSTFTYSKLTIIK
jgi:hypothetical protein